MCWLMIKNRKWKIAVIVLALLLLTLPTCVQAAVQNVNKENYSVEFTRYESWQREGGYGIKYEAQIANKSTAEIRDWEVKFRVPKGSEIANSWNGVFSVNGEEISVKPVEYNVAISPQSEIVFGFIIHTPKDFEPENIRMFISGTEYENGGVNKDNSLKKEAGGSMKTEIKKEKVVTTETGTPLENHGKLSVQGTNIVDKNKSVYQLKGASTHGINFFPQFVNKKAFQTMRDDWGANLIRIAMYTKEYNGYLAGGNQAELKNLIDSGVKAATELGMYVIIDWHILSDGNPNTNKEQAIAFFDEMSKKYADYDNVLYEICNEPNGGVRWEEIKTYADEVIAVIRANDKEAIIIVGTPTWSQDVDAASLNPVTNSKNVVYALHFYAATHKEDLRNKVRTAISNGIPIFISEFSICDASGNGNIDYQEADQWMKLIDEYHLSYAMWNLANKDEASSLIKSSSNSTFGWKEEELSETGRWLKKTLSGN